MLSRDRMIDCQKGSGPGCNVLGINKPEPITIEWQRTVNYYLFLSSNSPLQYHVEVKGLRQSQYFCWFYSHIIDSDVTRIPGYDTDIAISPFLLEML